MNASSSDTTKTTGEQATSGTPMCFLPAEGEGGLSQTAHMQPVTARCRQPPPDWAMRTPFKSSTHTMEANDREPSCIQQKNVVWCWQEGPRTAGHTNGGGALSPHFKQCKGGAWSAHPSHASSPWGKNQTCWHKPALRDDQEQQAAAPGGARGPGGTPFEVAAPGARPRRGLWHSQTTGPKGAGPCIEQIMLCTGICTRGACGAWYASVAASAADLPPSFFIGASDIGLCTCWPRW